MRSVNAKTLKVSLRVSGLKAKDISRSKVKACL